jgi:hypothetical protein
VAILRRILSERRIRRVRCSWTFTLLREIKRTYNPDTPVTEMDVLQPGSDAEPLVLDDREGEPLPLGLRHIVFHPQLPLQPEEADRDHDQLHADRTSKPHRALPPDEPGPTTLPAELRRFGLVSPLRDVPTRRGG